jgi:hypothetical protein
MTEEEKGSDERLGAQAIEDEQARVFLEELELGQEETVLKDVEPEDDEDTPLDDEQPPDGQEHPEYEELPPPAQEI